MLPQSILFHDSDSRAVLLYASVDRRLIMQTTQAVRACSTTCHCQLLLDQEAEVVAAEVVAAVWAAPAPPLGQTVAVDNKK
eukprot:COSAG02_NODE_59_length_43585_cov_39.087752_23_plen_81_part_00